MVEVTPCACACSCHHLPTVAPPTPTAAAPPQQTQLIIDQEFPSSGTCPSRGTGVSACSCNTTVDRSRVDTAMSEENTPRSATFGGVMTGGETPALQQSAKSSILGHCQRTMPLTETPSAAPSITAVTVASGAPPATGVTVQPATGVTVQPVTGVTVQPATEVTMQPAAGVTMQPATGVPAALAAPQPLPKEEEPERMVQVNLAGVPQRTAAGQPGSHQLSQPVVTIRYGKVTQENPMDLKHLNFKQKQLTVSAIEKAALRSTTDGAIKLFQEKDKVGNGILGMRDFQMVMNRMGVLPALSSREVEAIFRGFPAASDTELDYTKFVRACEEIRKHYPFTR